MRKLLKTDILRATIYNMRNNGRGMSKIIIRGERCIRRSLCRGALVVAALFSAFFVFFSCSNLFDDINVASPASSEVVTLTGTVSSSGRMAVPSASFAATQYTVTATAPTFSGTKEGSVNSTNKTFSIALPVGYKWTITIVMEVKESETDTEFKTIFQGSYTFNDELSLADVTAPISIVLAPLSSGTGNIDLAINPGSYSFEVEVLSEPIPGEWATKSPDYTNGIKVTGLTGGTYTIGLVFKNTDGIEVYSCAQTLNVFPNMTTNRWVSSGSSGPVSSDGTFAITSALVASYARTQIYVGANTHQMHDPADTNSGTPYAPLATLRAALEYIEATGDSTKDYTIHISGTQQNFTYSITSDFDSKMKSLTLCGMTGNTTDILYGTASGTVLAIATTKPVTIKNLKITNGNAGYKGGGIQMSAGTDVTLGTGALITGNRAFQKGGGVYVEGTSSSKAKLTIENGAEISANTLTDSNMNNGGFGLYADYAIISMTGGSICNHDGTKKNDGTSFSSANDAPRGIVRLKNTQFTMTGGKITGNKVMKIGGNLFVDANTQFMIDGGEISYGTIENDTDDSCGAGMWIQGENSSNKGTVTFKSGKIIGNEATSANPSAGGGVFIYNYGRFIVEGGEISGNSAEKGGAVFVGTNGEFKIKGSASIPAGVNGSTGAGKNDVYLDTDAKITVAGTLTPPESAGGKVATITLASPSDGLTVLEKDTSASAADFAAACGKFTLTDDENWVLGSDGKIVEIINASNAVSYIENMTSSGTVALSGTTEDISFNDINTALKALAQSTPSAKVTLDLSKVENLSIPDNWNSDQSMGFWGCDNIESVIFPDTLTNLGAYAFRDCTGLKSVVIPNSITVLKSSAFSGCTNLSSVTLPEGLTEIQYGVFGNCSSLTEIELPSTVEKIVGSFNGSGLTRIIIPEGVTEITNSAFSQCTNLTEAYIPNSVTTMTGATFNGCSSLTTVHLPENENYTKIETNTFNGCTSLSSIDIPQNVNTIGQGAFTGTGLSGELTIPEHVTTINAQAFSSCNGLTSVTLHNEFVQVGQSIFMNCTGLERVTIAGDFPIVDSGDAICVFKGCTSLREIDIQDGVTTIPGSTFNGCTSLTTIVLPNTVTVIDNQAFEDCTNLESISIPENVIEIDSYAFRRCGKLSGTLTIPASVKRIGKQIVADCSFDGVEFEDTISEWCQTTYMGFTGGTSIGAMSSNTATNLSTLQGSYYFYQPE